MFEDIYGRALLNLERLLVLADAILATLEAWLDRGRLVLLICFSAIAFFVAAVLGHLNLFKVRFYVLQACDLEFSYR